MFPLIILLIVSVMVIVLMSTYSDLESSTDAGTTSDTWVEVGVLEFNNKARRLDGLWCNAANLAATTNEANGGQYRFRGGMFPTGELIIQGPPSNGQQIGTQSQSMKHSALLVPFDGEVSPGQKMTMEFSSHTPDPTSGCAVVMGALYSDGGLHADFWNFFPRPSRCKGADTEANADVKSTAETSITALEVSSQASRIVGFGADMNGDAAATTGEVAIGYIWFRCSGIADFSPQKYPMPGISAAVLGTLVGGGVHASDSGSVFWPASIPTGGSRAEVVPHVVQIAANTGAVQGIASVLWA